jgi:hypothetical protein
LPPTTGKRALPVLPLTVLWRVRMRALGGRSRIRRMGRPRILASKQRETERKYDCRYSVLTGVFAVYLPKAGSLKKILSGLVLRNSSSYGVGLEL